MHRAILDVALCTMVHSLNPSLEISLFRDVGQSIWNIAQ